MILMSSFCRVNLHFSTHFILLFSTLFIFIYKNIHFFEGFVFQENNLFQSKYFPLTFIQYAFRRYTGYFKTSIEKIFEGHAFGYQLSKNSHSVVVVDTYLKNAMPDFKICKIIAPFSFIFTKHDPRIIDLEHTLLTQPNSLLKKFLVEDDFSQERIKHFAYLVQNNKEYSKERNLTAIQVCLYYYLLEKKLGNQCFRGSTREEKAIFLSILHNFSFDNSIRAVKKFNS